MYRISRDGQQPIADVDLVEAIEPAIRLSEPGRYHVDEIGAGPLPSGHTSRRWALGSSVRLVRLRLSPIRGLSLDRCRAVDAICPHCETGSGPLSVPAALTAQPFRILSQSAGAGAVH
jgi:hypothetical protein